MHRRRYRWIFVLAGVLATLSGCRHCCRRSVPPPAVAVIRPGCGPCAAPGAVPPGDRLAPQAPPPPTPLAPVSPPPPAPISPDVRRYSPPAAAIPPPGDPAWRPAPEGSGVRLNVPSTTETPEPPRDTARLAPPEPMPPGGVQPSVAEERSPSPPLPVGIPQFTIAQDHVASGLKPLLDGLDWLQKNGYRTVLHIHPPGENVSADRGQVQKRGLKYLSLEVSPQTLSKAVLDDFNHLVGDNASYPLFVYDRDGMLAGGLWYLHFRSVDRLPDAEARARATRLGLKTDPTGADQALWLAIQKLLSEQVQ